MRKLFISLFIVGFLFLFIAGCATTPSEDERWGKTYIGMPLEEFKQVWPEAKYGGQGDLQGTIEVWTVSSKYIPYVSTFSKNEMIYFQFQGNKLIKFTGN